MGSVTNPTDATPTKKLSDIVVLLAINRNTDLGLSWEDIDLIDK